MIRQIIQIGNPLLETPSKEVTFPLTQEMREIILDLKDTLLSTGDLGVGISAVQIGYNYRISIVKDFDLASKLKKCRSYEKLLNVSCHGKTFGEILSLSNPNLYNNILERGEGITFDQELNKEISNITDFVIVNPEIISENDFETYFFEGCLSVGVGDNALYAPVGRAEQIKIIYFNENGEKKELFAKNYFAHVILHEIDHMNGILFLSKVKDPSKIWKSIDLDKYYDKHKKYPPMF